MKNNTKNKSRPNYFRLCLVAVKRFSENTYFPEMLISGKGKYFCVFSCISKNFPEKIFWCLEKKEENTNPEKQATTQKNRDLAVSTSRSRRHEIAINVAISRSTLREIAPSIARSRRVLLGFVRQTQSSVDRNLAPRRTSQSIVDDFFFWVLSVFF